jgi:hypothetical protein
MIGRRGAVPSLRALKQFRGKRVKASCEKIENLTSREARRAIDASAAQFD